ncbi:MAG TPA: hypothetical protein DHW54_07595 [Gemmatimonadetes bacterium]|nr:hypothetical protein [Gemmatimonadota bacterium]
MKTLAGVSAVLGFTLMLFGGETYLPHSPQESSPEFLDLNLAPQAALTDTDLDHTEVVAQYCVRCHNDRRMTGNMSLEQFDASTPERNAELSEKMIHKLRAEMMPPPGARRPAGDTLLSLVLALESSMDAAAVANPNPGGRSFQRLNQAEYGRSILELLDLEIDAGDYLPLDTKSANFDNIADAQMLSPMLLDTYFRAAAEISRLAVGDPNVLPSSKTYTNGGYVSQWDRVEGAPFGTRGGISAVHTFPADGDYVFKMAFEHTTTGGFFGGTSRDEQIEISIDGERVALYWVDRFMNVSDPNGANMQSEPIFVRAGPRRVSAAFLRQAEGPREDVVSPHEWSLSDRQIGVSGYGVTALAHLKDLAITGPYEPTGVSETPSRNRVFSCRPLTLEEAPACAEEIISRLGPQAFRRSLTQDDVEGLMSFYELGFAEGGFELGVRTAIEAMLASPDFVFRLEEAPSGVTAGESYAVSNTDLASRLSFFLWGAPPDADLLAAAEKGELSYKSGLTAQVRRMLQDSRAEALGTRFASQWLRLEDLDKVHPDRLFFPDFYQQLADAMLRETELFFNGLVREDRSALELYTADYTYLNEALAKHYGIPGITGTHFRKVQYPDATRRGILGHGSILTLTSHANRTSPVLRGKWVLEVLLGAPPPPPPPGIPDLEETEDSEDGRLLTTRERMELHRSSPSCNSCHRFMDPIGLALDNYDVTGRWRIRENGMPLDTKGEFYDGTMIETPSALQEVLVKRPIPLVRTFTENLMAYALGRRVEYYDQPTIRSITAQAEEDDYRMSSFILGVVLSDAFRMQQVNVVVEDGSEIN